MARSPIPRLILGAWWGFALLGLSACASYRTPTGPARSLPVEVNNDVAPAADLELFLYPVGGNDTDRIRLGLVQGSSRRRIEVPVVEGGWYYLRAVRVVDIPDAPYPVARRRATSSWTSRRFTVLAETRSLVWRVESNSLSVEEGPPGSS